MSENYSRHSSHKSKSSRRYRDDKYTSKSRSRHEDSKKYRSECKTPPLPTKSNNSIEELIKQRESLKEELKKMGKISDNDPKNKSRDDRKRKHSSHSSSHHTKHSRTDRHNHNNENSHKREPSPEFQIQLDSEDEESIIEQRRKQRQQLLEKLSTASDGNHLNNDNKKDNDIHIEHDKDSSAINKVNTISHKEPSKGAADMFSEKDDFILENPFTRSSKGNNENNTLLTDNWDDSEGYYNVRVGDVLSANRYTIKDILGQGVFANVVRALDNSREGTCVAIKIVRNNDLMYKTGLKEVAILKEVNDADPENKYHCVRLLGNFMHKGHLCLVLEPLHMDLRSILKKYGKNHGINMKALISYTRQLLLALRLLKKVDIIHADIKPDNILVNEKKNVLKLCDFGSATKADDNEPTPYLVSRFYRAPEIILGVTYKHGVDMWSTACTVYEMATGKIMFTGSTNNHMLKCFMDLKGKIPSRLIKKSKFKDQHFNYNNNFLMHKKDEFTGRDKVVEIGNITVTRDLHKELKSSYKNLSPGEEKKLNQLKELLDKMVLLDSNQRISILDSLKHPFIQEEIEK